jgi:hypothetical protein
MSNMDMELIPTFTSLCLNLRMGGGNMVLSKERRRRAAPRVHG